MTVGEEIELGQIRQGTGGRDRVQVYANVLLVQDAKPLHFGSAGKRKLA
jgi:hypothetical protein